YRRSVRHPRGRAPDPLRRRQPHSDHRRWERHPRIPRPCPAGGQGAPLHLYQPLALRPVPGGGAMSSFKTVWRIAVREIREHGRSRSFLITTGFTFLAVAALLGVPGLVGDW